MGAVMASASESAAVQLSGQVPGFDYSGQAMTRDGAEDLDWGCAIGHAELQMALQARQLDEQQLAGCERLRVEGVLRQSAEGLQKADGVAGAVLACA